VEVMLQVLTKGGTSSLMSDVGHKEALKVFLKGVSKSHIGRSMSTLICA